MSQNAEISSVQPLTDAFSVSKSTILVVDDTPDNLALMSSLLKDSYQVKIANSGEKALKIAASDSAPPLILTRLDLDGFLETLAQ